MARLPLVPALVLPLLGWFPAAAAAQDETPPQEKYGLRLEYREYRPTATGDLKMGAGEEEGTLLDIVEDLGIQDERTFDARAIFKVKTKHKLRAGYMPIDYSGDQDAPRNFVFKSTLYFRDDRVVTTHEGHPLVGRLRVRVLPGRARVRGRAPRGARPGHGPRARGRRSRPAGDGLGGLSPPRHRDRGARLRRDG